MNSRTGCFVLFCGQKMTRNKEQTAQKWEICINRGKKYRSADRFWSMQIDRFKESWFIQTFDHSEEVKTGSVVSYIFQRKMTIYCSLNKLSVFWELSTRYLHLGFNWIGHSFHYIGKRLHQIEMKIMPTTIWNVLCVNETENCCAAHIEMRGPHDVSAATGCCCCNP